MLTLRCEGVCLPLATMSTPAEQAGINIDITVGALLIGTYISVALFGFTTLQGYNYYLNYPDDRWKVKSLVGRHCITIVDRLS